MRKKNKHIIMLMICVILYGGNTGKPAYEALMVFEPLIGEWEGKSESYGIFEGLPNKGSTKMINRSVYSWVLDKTAIKREWKTLSSDGKTVINIGTSIFILDPVTKNIVSNDFGYDGPVYWVGNGRATVKGSSFVFDIEEITINGTYTDYTMKVNLDGKDLMKWQIVDVTQDQKKLRDTNIQRLKRKY